MVKLNYLRINNPTTTPADPTADPGTDYGNAHADALCSTLIRYPSFGGINGIAEAIHERDGLSPFQAGKAIGTAVYAHCPQFIPLITAFGRLGTTLA